MEVKQMMRAMVLKAAKEKLRLELLPIPQPNHKQLLLKIQACGVCRTDLHIVDGELTQAKFPLILGHEIVGTVEALGKGVKRFSLGERVVVPWLKGSSQPRVSSFLLTQANVALDCLRQGKIKGAAVLVP